LDVLLVRTQTITLLAIISFLLSLFSTAFTSGQIHPSFGRVG